MTEKSKTTPCPAAHTRIGNIKEFEYTPRISLFKTGDQNDFVSKLLVSFSTLRAVLAFWTLFRTVLLDYSFLYGN